MPIGLIPTALGGSPLCAWEPGSPEGAFLYENMVTMIAAAGGQVAGMVWYQGCSDAGEQTAPSYLARFSHFVESFRAQYGANLPVITAQLNRYLDAQPEQDRPWSQLREAQRQAARLLPNLAVVPTLDLTLSDGIHTSAIGNVILGQRFARAALGMVYGQALPWRAVDIAGAAFTDAERTAVRLSFAHVADHLVLLSLCPRDYLLEDADGTVPIQAARVDGNAAVLLELARPARGATVCHNLFGCDPISTLRDHLQRPVLAFYGIEVE